MTTHEQVVSLAFVLGVVIVVVLILLFVYRKK